jgi:hypothetical protein
LPVKGIAAGVYLSEGQNPIFTQGRRGRVEPERRGEGQLITNLGRKYLHEMKTPEPEL